MKFTFKIGFLLGLILVLNSCACVLENGINVEIKSFSNNTINEVKVYTTGNKKSHLRIW